MVIRGHGIDKPSSDTRSSGGTGIPTNSLEVTSLGPIAPLTSKLDHIRSLDGQASLSRPCARFSPNLREYVTIQTMSMNMPVDCQSDRQDANSPEGPSMQQRQCKINYESGNSRQDTGTANCACERKKLMSRSKNK